MTSTSLNPVALAAQADLLLLSVEMLRAPQATEPGGQLAWSMRPASSLHAVLQLAFCDDVAVGSDARSAMLLEGFEIVLRQAQSLDLERWRHEYWRLFGGAQLCAMNQASYIRRDKGAILGDLCGFYGAFGFQVSQSSGERADHLLCQLEFMAMMLAMAARADEGEQREIVHDALAKFARIHVHDWLPSVCHELMATTQLPYYAAVGQWILLLMTRLTELHEWPVDPVSSAPLAPDDEPESPYECAAPDLVQLTGKTLADNAN